MFRWSTGVDGRAICGRFSRSSLDPLNQPLVDRSLSTVFLWKRWPSLHEQHGSSTESSGEITESWVEPQETNSQRAQWQVAAEGDSAGPLATERWSE
ncbi:hypothetical protein UY3_10138 [Chelonia mydas]|uniref:Uncharacterized protein n=1 Tax=Chelonia mydas TaxID=8469 RepID=M7B6I1_CHEMY|nr:hypothetical protein UY3_10138 [Chelonia mydas]